ncbi:MAG: type II toxin-antitoxin system VapB family antitoxin [Pseudonocardia sp.]|nr:type II toxin-antitoxin system VapB family antitoxin [Pseudonocardia sp.]
MSRTVIDIDDDLLGRAAELLHTRTKRDTVNAALRVVVARQARMAELDRLARGELPDLADPDLMAQAWR